MDDERLAKIEQEKQNAINQSNNMYDSLLSDNQNLYNQQQDYTNKYEQTQNEALDKQLAFTQNEIEKQKEEARKNQQIENTKAKNDYTAFINPYGYQAEQMASQGLTNSGVEGTAKLGGFNSYQNRLAASNKATQDAITQYDKDMNEARLNNDVQKAQNALEKLQMQLQFAESYYSNKTNISQNKLSNNQNLDSEYNNRYQTEYANIQNEKAQEEAIRQWEAQMAEQRRQYDTTMAYQKEQDELAQSNWEKEYALSKKSSSSSGSSNGSYDLEDTSGETEELDNPNMNPYTKTINSDCQYGTFDNGYQPNNINGQKLSKSGQTLAEYLGTIGSENSGGKNIDNQNVWKLGDSYYAWDGYANEYVKLPNVSKKGGGSNAFGASGGGGVR